MTIARDKIAMFLGALAVTITRKCDPKILKDIACGEALALAADLSIRIIYEATDYLRIVNTL